MPISPMTSLGQTDHAAAPAPRASMPLCQIALSVTDLARTHHWYRRALGFFAAGRSRRLDAPELAVVPDLPEASLDVWCLVDRQDWFQFEVMEFRRPRMRLLDADRRPCDIGYAAIGLHVADFDEALDRFRRTSGRLLGAPIGPAGARRVCLRDPEGILLEIMEDDVRMSHAPRARVEGFSAARFIRVSVPDLDRARRFWVDALGLVEATGVSLHEPEHERLWGLDGAATCSLLLWADDFLVELVEYTRPVGRDRPAGYLLSDQGILNVAFGSQERSDFDAALGRIRRLGFRTNSQPWTLDGVASVVYVTDDQGFSVELMHVEPGALAEMGFVAASESAPRDDGRPPLPSRERKA